MSSRWPPSRATNMMVWWKHVNWSRALPGVEWSARPTWARYNKSLDASGISGLVIDNLSVTWLFPAASTQPFGRLNVHTTTTTLNCSFPIRQHLYIELRLHVCYGR